MEIYLLQSKRTHQLKIDCKWQMVDSHFFSTCTCILYVLYTGFHKVFKLGFVESMNIENFGIFRLDKVTDQTFCSQ